MKVARYWNRDTAEAVARDGRKIQASAWGWSSSSPTEAQSRASASAVRLARWLAGLDPAVRPPSAQYQYLEDRPPREEIVQEFADRAGQTSAMVTRNSYGSLVLNCRDLAFVDADIPQEPQSLRRAIASLFGRKPEARSPDEIVLSRLRDWCAANSSYGTRLYRTAGGFRLAIVNRRLEATTDEARRILKVLGSDELYRRLCESQGCFRARLSPKPWRISVSSPAVRYPFPDAAAEERMRRWEADYDKAARRYATCRLVEHHGPPDVHPALAPLLELHDSLTKAEEGLPLA